MCKNSYAVICATKTHEELIKNIIKKNILYLIFTVNLNLKKEQIVFYNRKKLNFWKGYPINLLSKEFSIFIKDIKKIIIYLIKLN